MNRRVFLTAAPLALIAALLPTHVSQAGDLSVASSAAPSNVSTPPTATGPDISFPILRLPWEPTSQTPWHAHSVNGVIVNDPTTMFAYTSRTEWWDSHDNRYMRYEFPNGQFMDVLQDIDRDFKPTRT